MKHLLSILLISTLFAGELEVDGNLKVTGTVESVTIDSLKAVIAELQAQLAALQEQMETIQASNNWETRMYTISINLNIYSIHEIDMFDLTGYDLNGAVISYFTSDNITITDYDNPYDLDLNVMDLPDINVDNAYLNIKKIAQKYIDICQEVR